MNKIINTIENATIVCGLSVGFAEIESILGIIILVVQLVLILWKMGYSVYQKIKNKEYDQVDDEIEKGIEDILALTDSKGDKDANE